MFGNPISKVTGEKKNNGNWEAHNVISPTFSPFTINKICELTIDVLLMTFNKKKKKEKKN